MKPILLSKPVSAVTRAVACVTLACALSAPLMAKKSELPEVSSDGLHLVPDTKVYAVYAKQGIALGQYTKVKLLDCYVQFKDNYQREYNMDEIGLQGRISTQDMETIKQRLAEEFRKVFTEQLQKAGHQVVDEAGPDVLLLRPAIINLDVTAPDLMKSGRGNTYVNSAGQMTLYMELYDSASSELLARIIDPEAGQEGGFGFVASRVTNQREADLILRRWADLLGAHLSSAQQQVAGQ
ncbi:MAG TPA: DUF3313 family protein [Xanthomonadales bacterium]|nr:DUF3313 family protein [Xanthomonadales bacterium]